MQTIAFGVDKQWDLAVEHRELYSVTCDGTWWGIMWEEECVCIYVCVYIYITESLGCTAEIDRTL